MKIRVGVPLTGGQMVRFVHERGMPVLFSANAFFSRDREGRTRLRPVTLPKGLDAALDSAGFVAMARYNGYPWSDEQYLDLVATFPWAWYSAMDMCVEAEIASDRLHVRMRLAGTINGYYRVRRKALARGLPAPIPVLQGRHLADYLWCAERLPMDAPIIGLGSFCRRDVGGTDGIVNLVDELDRRLPAGARFHLFGVKGKALEFIGQHPRIASIDSMAWDLQARYGAPVGRSMAYRLRVMDSWFDRNRALKGRAAAPPQHHVEQHTCEPADLDSTDEIAQWMELVESGEIDYASAMAHMHHLQIGAGPQQAAAQSAP